MSGSAVLSVYDVLEEHVPKLCMHCVRHEVSIPLILNVLSDSAESTSPDTARVRVPTVCRESIRKVADCGRQLKITPCPHPCSWGGNYPYCILEGRPVCNIRWRCLESPQVTI